MKSNNIYRDHSWHKEIIITLLMAFCASALFAQKVNITGTVLDEVGKPLDAVFILEVGTTNGTRTDKAGKYTLGNVQVGSKLRAGFLGRISQEKAIKKGENVVNFTLHQKAQEINEVTVNTGLYKRPVGNFTGAAKTYSGAELKMVNPRSAIQALAIVDPSVRLQQNNQFGSDPNSLPNIQIRGANNLNTNPLGANGSTPVSNGDIMASYLANPNQPLIILDGFETTMQVFYDMDINLIENVTVLKDAAATVAYGSKAANGVIVIDTKQPQAGKLRINYSFNVNAELADLTSYNMMNASQLLEAQRLSGIYNDVNNQYNDFALQRWYNRRLGEVQSGVDTYWLSQPVQTGFGHSHSLSLSGGSGPLRYSFGVNYNNSEGVIKGSGRERYGMNYNLSYTLKNVKVNNIMSVGYTNSQNSAWGSFSSYVKQMPFFRSRDENGVFVKFLEPSGSELGIPIAAPGGTFVNAAYNSTLNVKDVSSILTITNNTNVEWTVWDNLRLTGSLGWTSNSPESDAFYPADHTRFASSSMSFFQNLGSYSRLTGNNTSINGRLNLSYRLLLGRHTILANLGGSLQKTTSKSVDINVFGIPNDYMAELGLANGFDHTTTKPRSIYNQSKNLSNFLSVSYNYDNRYTAEATVNQSGSSQFGSNSRFAPFYAGGVAWNINNEKFFKENPIIHTAKLNASIGITGNQNFSSDMAQQIYQYNLLNNYRLMIGANTPNYANPNLSWQQTVKTNLGLNVGFFKGKLNANIDIFKETTDNLILPLDLAPSTGFDTYQDNMGAIKNTGFEFGLSAPIIKKSAENIFWTVGLNAGHYDNVITRLSPAIEAINEANNKGTNPGNSLDSRYQTSPLPRFEVGESMSRIWAVPSLGIDPATGKEVFVKLDGSRSFTWDARDKRPIAESMATFKGAFNSNFNYKSFVLNFIFSYQYGGYTYNQTLVDRVENVDLRSNNADLRVLTERWKQPGDQASFKALVANGTNGLQQTNATSRFVQKDNFLELASLTVGYNVPASARWVKKLRLSAPRFMITQNNLFRLGTIKTERGTAYPFARSFNFGLSTNF